MLNTLITNSDFLGFLSGVLALLVTIYVFKATPKYQLVRERYDLLIFPVFKILEPHLFKPLKEDVLNEVVYAIEKNRHLAGGKLDELVYLCKKAPNQYNYNKLCRCINSEYDNACLRLGLKRRSITYRVIRDQYQTPLMFVLYLIANLLFFLLTIFFTFLIFSLIVTGLDTLLQLWLGISIFPVK